MDLVLISLQTIKPKQPNQTKPSFHGCISIFYNFERDSTFEFLGLWPSFHRFSLSPLHVLQGSMDAIIYSDEKEKKNVAFLRSFRPRSGIHFLHTCLSSHSPHCKSNE